MIFQSSLWRWNGNAHELVEGSLAVAESVEDALHGIDCVLRECEIPLVEFCHVVHDLPGLLPWSLVSASASRYFLFEYLLRFDMQLVQRENKRLSAVHPVAFIENLFVCKNEPTFRQETLLVGPSSRSPFRVFDRPPWMR